MPFRVTYSLYVSKYRPSPWNVQLAVEESSEFRGSASDRRRTESRTETKEVETRPAFLARWIERSRNRKGRGYDEGPAANFIDLVGKRISFQVLRERPGIASQGIKKPGMMRFGPMIVFESVAGREMSDV